MSRSLRIMPRESPQVGSRTLTGGAAILYVAEHGMQIDSIQRYGRSAGQDEWLHLGIH